MTKPQAPPLTEADRKRIIEQERQRRLKEFQDQIQYIKFFWTASSERDLFFSIIRLGIYKLNDWLNECEFSIEQWPDENWLMEALYDNSRCKATDHRRYLECIKDLQIEVKKTPKATSLSMKKPFLTKSKQWTRSREFDKEFAEIFRYDPYQIDHLFSLTYLAAADTILNLLASDRITQCTKCLSPMEKIGKRTFCSEFCRTKFNNEKRDPKIHNAREKENRYQRRSTKHARSSKE